MINRLIKCLPDHVIMTWWLTETSALSRKLFIVFGFQGVAKSIFSLTSKISAISDFPLPHTKRQLKSHLGLYQ